MKDLIKFILLRLAFLVILLFTGMGAGESDESPFDLGEIQVASSPAKSGSLSIPEKTQILDFDVSPFGPEVAVLVRDERGVYSVLFWEIGRETPSG